MSARGRLIVALDVDDRDAALALAEPLAPHVAAFKVGKQLFTREGPALVRELRGTADGLFLDLKFHDIPNTVAGAVAAAADLGATLVNVHAQGGPRMIAAAAEALRGTRTKLLAVTVLTSLDDADLERTGLAGPAEAAVVRLAALARDAGADGVVASPREIHAIRQACGPDFLVVTPGIRPADAASDDQARVATPSAAVAAGADYIVVGRPITRAPDPAAAAAAVVREIAAS